MDNAEIKLEVLSRAEADNIDADAWRTLADRAAVVNPFYERWALLPALRFLEPAERVFLVVVFRGETLSGLFPVKFHKGRLGWRYLSVWKYQDCYLTDPLFLPGLDLVAVYRRMIDSFGVCCLLSASHTSGTCLDSMNAVCVVRERGAITDAMSWSEYEAKQPRKVRKENKRVVGRALRDAKYVVATNGFASDWLPWFLSVEASGWKGRGGWAVEQDKNRKEFLYELMRLGEVENKIEFQALVAGEEILAVAFRYIARGCAFEVKTAFNEDYSRFYPGVVLELLNVKDLLAKGIEIGDSCAASHNDLINRVWPGRRRIYKTVEFRGSMVGRGKRVAYALYRRMFDMIGNNGSAGKMVLLNKSEVLK